MVKAAKAEAEPLAPEPRAQSELIGHESAERALLTAWRSGRLPHAWLITGPRGIGKATLAYRFARFALAGGDAGDRGGLFGGPAPAADSLAMAPDHPVFRRVAASAHPDLLTVEKGVDPKSGRERSAIGVEDARGIGTFLSLTPAEGGWRVVIVDSADEMTRNAANAMLKTLEEPPPRSLLLLVCHAPGRIPSTVRSRCRKLALGPLAEPDVAMLLGRFLPEASEGDRVALARMGEGSVGRALALAGAGGLDLYRELLAFAGRLPKIDVAAAHTLADRLARAGANESFAAFAELIGWWIARLVRMSAGVPLPGEVVPGEHAALQKAAGLRRLDQWAQVWENTARLFGQGEGLHLDRKQVLLSALMALEPEARA
ncbi:MAG: DNA polymerase III subunit delta' [Gemmatimonas sp.]